MRRLLCLPVLLAAGLPAAGGADAERPAAPAPADSTRLVVEVTRAQPDPMRVELRCGSSTRPCDQDRIGRLGAALDKAKDRARACTLQYGGPERAHVTGTLDGRNVDVSVDRAEIAPWSTAE